MGLFLLLWIIAGTCSAFEFIVQTNPNAPQKEDNSKSCVVAIHDNVRGYLNWNQDWFVKAAKEHNVKIREMKENGIGKHGPVDNVDVVIFHAPTHQNRVSKSQLHKSYGRKAMFAFLSMEQPNYATIMKDYKYLENTFDLMITYSLSSIYPNTNIPNMPITYYPSHILSVNEVLKPPVYSFKEKDGYGTGVTVSLFTSNCKLAGANERLKYIQELMQYIDIHSYGGCLNNRKEPDFPNDPAWPAIAQRRARKIKVLSHYRFYLAFENAPVDDYVSEKVFEGLFAGAIPVYRGAQSIHRFMPANDSFIDANNMSPKELATLLKRLGSNEKEYEKYFLFKQRPITESFQSIVDMSYVHPNVLRRVCSYAHSSQSSLGQLPPADTKSNNSIPTEEGEEEGAVSKPPPKRKSAPKRKNRKSSGLN